MAEVCSAPNSVQMAGFLERYSSLQAELKLLSEFIFGKESMCAPVAVFDRAKCILEILSELKLIWSSSQSGCASSPPLVEPELALESGVAAPHNEPANSVTLPVKSDGGCDNGQLFSVFVDNVPPGVSFVCLGNLFKEFGPIADVYIPPIYGRNGKRFGFVRFKSKIDGLNAIDHINGKMYKGFALDVSWARFSKKSKSSLRSKRVTKECKWVPKAAMNLEVDGSVSSKTITDPVVSLSAVKAPIKSPYKDALLRGLESRDEPPNKLVVSDCERTVSAPSGNLVVEVDSFSRRVLEESSHRIPKARGRKKRNLNLLWDSKWQLVSRASCRSVSSRSGLKKGKKKISQSSMSSSEDGAQSNAKSLKKAIDLSLDRLDEEAHRAAKIADVLKMLHVDQETATKAFRDDLLEKKKKLV